jgi:L-amino acid N-acyltransferase YncA
MIMKAHTYKLTAYPKEVTLRDGTRITLKPMARADAGALLDFFRRIPADDRFYLKEDVTDARVIQRWADELDYDRALPLLGWVNGRVVSDATLHRSRANARRHVGQIRIAVDPEYRSRGVGATMLHELAAIADENGLERIVLEAVAEKEDQAIKAAEFVGFVRVGLLPGHARDLDGRPRDIVLLEMPLGKWFDWWDY